VPIGLPNHWTTLSNADLSKPLWASQRDGSLATTSSPLPGTLSLRGLLDLGQNPQNIAPGEVRLIGWSDDDLPGLSIKPAAPQAKRGILVVAHLGYGLGDPPRPDEKLTSTEMP